MDDQSEMLVSASGTMPDVQLPVVELFKEYSDGLLEFATASCLIIMLVGIPGNIITILALARYQKVRNATAIFIINLSCSDLLYCFNMPIVIFAFHRQVWSHGEFLCQMSLLTRYTLSVNSAVTVCAIAINRYILIAHPKLYTKIYETRNIIIMLVCLWILSIGSMTLIVVVNFGRHGFDINNGSCYRSILKDHGDRSTKKILNLIGFILPCMVIILCYTRIFCIVRKATKKSLTGERVQNPERSSLGYLLSSLVRVIDETSCNYMIEGIKTTRMESSRNTNTTYMSTKIEMSIQTSRQLEKMEKEQPVLYRTTLQKSIRFLKMALPIRKDKRLGTMIIAIMISFCLFHLPLTITTVFLKKKLHPNLNIAAHILYFLSCSINPIIYVVMSNEYRKAYKLLFKRLKTLLSLNKFNEVKLVTTAVARGSKIKRIRTYDSTNYF